MPPYATSAVARRLEAAAEVDAAAAREVRRDAHLRAGPGEHDRVPALVGDLGQRELEVGGGVVAAVLVAQDHLLQDHLEPDAGAHDRGDLVPGQRHPLLVGHLVPQARAVERAPLRVEPEVGRVEGGVPVDLGRGVVGQRGRRVEQALRAVALGRRWRSAGVMLDGASSGLPKIGGTRCSGYLEGTTCTPFCTGGARVSRVTSDCVAGPRGPRPRREPFRRRPGDALDRSAAAPTGRVRRGGPGGDQAARGRRVDRADRGRGRRRPDPALPPLRRRPGAQPGHRGPGRGDDPRGARPGLGPLLQPARRSSARPCRPTCGG